MATRLLAIARDLLHGVVKAGSRHRYYSQSLREATIAPGCQGKGPRFGISRRDDRRVTLPSMVDEPLAEQRERLLAAIRAVVEAGTALEDDGRLAPPLRRLEELLAAPGGTVGAALGKR
jgi:hypothetical protein